MTYSNSQSGNVLFIILIAVMLFAALSYVVSGMMRGSVSNAGSEKSGIYASEILTYARSVKESVQMMRISNGCADTDISFERSPFDGSDAAYVNASSPANFSCHVFHTNGGGVAQMEMQEDVFDSTYSADINYGIWMIGGLNKITGVGNNSNGELILVLPFLKKVVCDVITKRVGQSSTIVSDADGVNISEFTGAYSASTTYDNVDNILHGCINITGGADPLQYSLFTVLIAR